MGGMEGWLWMDRGWQIPVDAFERDKHMRDIFGANNMLLEVTVNSCRRILRGIALSLPGEDT